MRAKREQGKTRMKTWMDGETESAQSSVVSRGPGVKSDRRGPTELWRNYAFHPSQSR